MSGLPVPSISTVQQQKLFLAVEKAGLTAERRVEAVGINAARMALQLLGGTKRYDSLLISVTFFDASFPEELSRI